MAFIHALFVGPNGSKTLQSAKDGPHPVEILTPGNWLARDEGLFRPLWFRAVVFVTVTHGEVHYHQPNVESIRSTDPVCKLNECSLAIAAPMPVATCVTIRRLREALAV